MHRLLLPSLLCCLFLVAACAKPTARTPLLDRASIEQEKQYQHSRVKQQTAPENSLPTSYDIPALQRRLDEVERHIAAASLQLCPHIDVTAANCSFDVLLEPDPKKAASLNAYADGKRVVISPAMVSFTQNNAELAFIVAHEMAHNILRHVNAKQQNALAGGLLGILAEIAADQMGVNTGGQLAKIGLQGGANAYSPSFEREADYVGLYIMALSDYDPRQAPGLWRRMSHIHPQAIYLTTTHPSNPERYVFMQYTIAEIEEKRQRQQALIPDFTPKS